MKSQCYNYKLALHAKANLPRCKALIKLRLIIYCMTLAKFVNY